MFWGSILMYVQFFINSYSRYRFVNKHNSFRRLMLVVLKRFVLFLKKTFILLIKTRLLIYLITIYILYPSLYPFYMFFSCCYNIWGFLSLLLSFYVLVYFFFIKVWILSIFQTGYYTVGNIVWGFIEVFYNLIIVDQLNANKFAWYYRIAKGLIYRAPKPIIIRKKLMLQETLFFFSKHRWSFEDLFKYSQFIKKNSGVLGEFRYIKVTTAPITVNWLEVWNFDTTYTMFDQINHSSNLYLKYRLTSFFNWHVIDDRTTVFVILFFFLLI